jgi:CHAT domain-containing protein
MTGVKQITIYQKGDAHIVDLGEINVLVSKTEIPVDRQFIRNICQEIKKITLAANRQLPEKSFLTAKSTILSDLKETGRLLFDHLFPEDIQRILRESRGSDLYLRLDENLLYIPWELCHDGEEFLTLKFQVGRQVLTGQKPRQYPAPSPSETINLLIVLDPSETLPNAQREAEELCSILEENTQISIEIIGGRQADKLKLLKALEGKDLVHFIGHSVHQQGPSKETGWLLKEGMLTAEEISKLNNPPGIVFSNSCQSLAADEQGCPYFDEKSLGVGGGFMMAGVRNFIGTTGAVSDQGSVQFAVRFYWELTAGKPLGESLQEAKRNVIRAQGKNHLLWAAYLLYGDPGYRLPGFKQASKESPPFRRTEPVDNSPADESPSIEPQPPMRPLQYPDIPLPASLSLDHFDLPSHRLRNILLVTLSILIIAGLGYLALPPLLQPVAGVIKTKWLPDNYPVAGPWGWKKGYYTILSDYWDGRALSFLTKQPLMDFQVEIKVQPGQAAWPDAGYGVILRSEDGTKALIFYMNGEGASWISEENGQRQFLAQSQDLLVTDGSRLIIKGRNGHYEALVNGVNVLSVRQPAFPVNIGIVVESRWKETPGFKDMKVEKG